jgi:hypothetical protein
MPSGATVVGSVDIRTCIFKCLAGILLWLLPKQDSCCKYIKMRRANVILFLKYITKKLSSYICIPYNRPYGNILVENIILNSVLFRRVVSSGMLHHVAIVRTDVSKELNTSMIRVTRIGDLGTTLAITNNRSTLRRNTNSYKSFRAGNLSSSYGNEYLVTRTFPQYFQARYRNVN